MKSTEPYEVRKNRVVDRLALVRALISLKAPLAKPTQTGPLPDGSYATDYDQHDSLINYLLLTCFDVLGQDSEHVQFGEWLTSKDLAVERQEALDSLEPDLSPLEATKTLHARYNKKYGTTQGFYRFIDVLLKPTARQKLFDSIGLARHPAFENADQVVKLKKEFLYKFRNNFTHGAIARTTVSRLADGTRLAVAEVNGASHSAKKSFKMVSGSLERVAYFAGDWPFVLYETVAGAIGEPIPDFEDTHTIVVTFSSGASGTIGNVSRADFTDPMKRAQIIAAVDALLNRPQDPKETEEWDVEAALAEAKGNDD